MVLCGSVQGAVRVRVNVGIGGEETKPPSRHIRVVEAIRQHLVQAMFVGVVVISMAFFGCTYMPWMDVFLVLFRCK